MATTASKKRNPQDSTLRNVRAASKKLAALDDYVMKLALAHAALEQRVVNLEKTTHLPSPKR